jgi:RNA polymerase sigma factor (TIGR02999 family)
MDDVTELLQRAAAGDPAARDALFESLYPQLRRLAHARLRDTHGLSQLQTTALVHEAYLRVANHSTRAGDAAQFMAYAAHVMRSIIVDQARRALADRHGGQVLHVEFDAERHDVPLEGAEEIIRVHDALLALESADERAAKVVELRYFAGYDEAETARIMGLPLRSVQRLWAKSRLLLAEHLRE